MSAANTDMTFTIEIKKEGKVPQKVTLKRPSFEAETDLCNWVRQRAFAAAETIPDLGTRQMTLAGIAGQIASGQYDWDFDASTGLNNWIDISLKSVAGQKEFMFFCLRASTPSNRFRLRGGRDYFIENVWNIDEKRMEVFAKLGMFLQPNPQTSLEEEEEDLQGAEQEQITPETTVPPQV